MTATWFDNVLKLNDVSKIIQDYGYPQLRGALPAFIVRVIDTIIKVEGGYVDDPDDRGGKTNWGITEAVARQHGWTRHMRELPQEFAFIIYLKSYYLAPRFHDVAALHEGLAEELTDTGVNMGIGWGARFLQQSINAFNAGYTRDVGVDGALGNITLGALHEVAKRVDLHYLEVAANCLQGARYIAIANANHRNRSFTYGWFAHRVALPSGQVKKANKDFATVARLSPAVADEMASVVDGNPVVFLQQALNSLSFRKNRTPLFANLTPDGVAGSKTFSALDLYLKYRGRDGELQLLKALNSLQGANLIALAQQGSAQLREGLARRMEERILMPAK